MASIITSRAGSGLGLLAVLVHHAREQRLIERAPVDADAHRLVILDGALDHGAEVVVVLAADRDVAGIDAVLGESARRGGILLEQDVAVVVEVADDGHADAALVEAFDDVRNGGGGVFVVDRDAHQLRAGEREGRNLLDGATATSAVSVLVIDCTTTGNFPANANVADFDGGGFSALNLRHEDSLQRTESREQRAGWRSWRRLTAVRFHSFTVPQFHRTPPPIPFWG